MSILEIENIQDKFIEVVNSADWAEFQEKFNNCDDIYVLGHGGEIGYGGYGRGWRSGGYHGNNDYSYGVGDASDVDPVYVCDEGDNRDLCPYRYYGILYYTQQNKIVVCEIIHIIHK